MEEFDAQRSQARKFVMAHIENTAQTRLEGGIIPGSSFRNVHLVSLLQGLITRRYGFPAYVMVYQYRGTLFRAVINGQNASCVHGTAPYSFWKIAGAVSAVLALSALMISFLG